MESVLLTTYMVVAVILLFRHGSTYAMHMTLNAVPLGGYIPAGSRWRIWYALIVSAGLWPIALLVAQSFSGGAEGRYIRAVKFTTLGMLLGGGWGAR